MKLWNPETMLIFAKTFPLFTGNTTAGTLEPWNYGILDLWNTGTMEPWNYGNLELWNSRTMEPWNYGTLEHWNPGTIKL